jgi:hypothetical protein
MEKSEDFADVFFHYERESIDEREISNWFLLTMKQGK